VVIMSNQFHYQSNYVNQFHYQSNQEFYCYPVFNPDVGFYCSLDEAFDCTKVSNYPVIGSHGPLIWLILFILYLLLELVYLSLQCPKIRKSLLIQTDSDPLLFQYLRPIFDFKLYRGFFLVPNFLTWFMYNECRCAYISHIYQADKYGVVLSYAFLSIIKLFTAMSEQIAHLQGSSTPHFHRRILKVLALTFGFKVVAFSFIFQHHTSDKQSHKNIHVLGVILLGLLQLLDTTLTPLIVRHDVTDNGKNRKKTVSEKTMEKTMEQISS